MAEHSVINKQTNKQIIQSKHYTIWQLIKAYWQSEHRAKAYWSVLFMLVMTIGLVAFDVVFNYWYNYFYNALQAYDVHASVRLLFVFFLLAGFYIILAVYRFYISQTFGLHWRRWLTDQFITRWLQNRGYYYLEIFDEKTDNPDQRIQDDIGTLVSNSIDLVIGLVGSITTFFAFIYILWTLSGVMHIDMGSWGVLHIPGYLVWVSVIYSLVGTWITFKVGKPLVGLNFEQQRREATFRYAAIDLRSHAENVALYRGEAHQKGILQYLFEGVLENRFAIIVRQKLLLWYTAGYNQISVVLPLVVALPNYFEKIFLLGGLIQTLRAFSSVQEALSFLINSYTQIAQWRAISQRLTTFTNHLTDSQEKAEQENKLVFHQQMQNAIVAKQVSITTPNHKRLLENVDTEFMHGKNYLIKGVSGIGKSTFIRALAGIWPYASGEVILPENKKLMYLPQKPYMPMGTLADAILYPDRTHDQSKLNLEKILRDCRLEYLTPRLYETASWFEQLSPGEQQRIGFARVLVHQPDWVFLDESTSMLDVNNEEHLYQLLKEKLPNCSLISIGHRPTLDAYHEKIINMEKYSEQAIA